MYKTAVLQTFEPRSSCILRVGFNLVDSRLVECLFFCTKAIGNYGNLTLSLSPGLKAGKQCTLL